MLNNLAWLLATRFDEPERAIHIVGRAQHSQPIRELPIYFIDTMATVFQVAGQKESARRVVESGLESYPKSAALLYQRGTLLADAGQLEAAYDSFQSALHAGLPQSREAEALDQLQKLQAVGTTNSTDQE